MNHRLLVAALLAGAFVGTAHAAEGSGAGIAAETMEHVEVIGYPAPAVAGQALLAEKEALAKQLLQQSIKELLNSARELQQRQLQLFRRANNAQTAEELVQDLPLQQMKPRHQSPPEMERETSGVVEPERESGGEEASPQEPS